MKFTTLLQVLRVGALLAVSLLTTTALRAQAQFAGTYIGTLNTKVSIPGVQTIESTSGGYIATVSADGTISVAGTLTGTVSASGAVTFTGGSALASLGIRSATIANNQLSSNYGDVVGNGTTQFRLNGSTSFTAAPGGGTGGTGGTGGSGAIDTPDLAQAALRGKTLTITVADSSGVLRTSGNYAITLSATGNDYTLTNLTSTMVNATGTYTYDNHGNPNGVIDLVLTNMVAGLEPLVLGLRVQSGQGRF